MTRPVRKFLSSSSLSFIGIPKKFHNSILDDFKTYNSSDLQEIKDFFQDYIFNIEIGEVFKSNKGIFMYGSNGVGKSFLASLVLKQAYRCRYSARRVTFAEYVTEYTKMWGAKTPEQKEELEELFYAKYKAVEFLVLEEIGKEIDTKVSAPILEDLLRYREDKGFVTIVCTNIKPTDIKDKYGASVGSLIKGNMTPVLIEGVDKRLKFYESR